MIFNRTAVVVDDKYVVKATTSAQYSKDFADQTTTPHGVDFVLHREGRDIYKWGYQGQSRTLLETHESVKEAQQDLEKRLFEQALGNVDNQGLPYPHDTLEKAAQSVSESLMYGLESEELSKMDVEAIIERQSKKTADLIKANLQEMAVDWKPTQADRGVDTKTTQEKAEPKVEKKQSVLAKALVDQTKVNSDFVVIDSKIPGIGVALFRWELGKDKRIRITKGVYRHIEKFGTLTKTGINLWRKGVAEKIRGFLRERNNQIERSGLDLAPQSPSSSSNPSPASTSVLHSPENPSERPTSRILMQHELPEQLQKRFLTSAQTPGKFFLHGTKELAFLDKGQKLTTGGNQPEVIQSMIDLAKEKGWTSINIKGSEGFKKETWLQASLEGIEVNGYKPTDVDLAALEQAKEARLQNRMYGASPAPAPQPTTEAQTKALSIDQNGNWKLYTNHIPANAEPLGVVTRGIGDTGAFVRFESGLYAQVNAGAVRNLNSQEVALALKASPEKSLVPKDYKPSPDAIAATEHLRKQGLGDTAVRHVMYGIDLSNEAAKKIGAPTFQARVLDPNAKPQAPGKSQAVKVKPPSPQIDIAQPSVSSLRR